MQQRFLVHCTGLENVFGISEKEDNLQGYTHIFYNFFPEISILFDYSP